MSDLKQKLQQLKELLDAGLIDEADFAEQKRALLSAAMGASTPLDGATRVVPAGPRLPERIGSYRVLEAIGSGGMGTVVRARHTEEGWARRQGGDVAIKLIHPEIASDPDFRERFLGEAELGRRLQHPLVASVFDVVVEGPWLGSVMSLIEGRGLAELIRPPGLGLEDALKLLRPLAETLDALHGEGVVHRDLKPSNITIRASDGLPVLLDLGIATDVQRAKGLTRTGMAIGTAGWMAPEQADGQRAGPAADRYALGLIAYALLAGRMPWPSDASEARVLSVKLTDALTPLDAVASGLPASAVAAVASMLTLDPSSRPSSCQRFVEQLVAKPEAPRPPPPRAVPKAPAAPPPRARPKPKRPPKPPNAPHTVRPSPAPPKKKPTRQHADLLQPSHGLRASLVTWRREMERDGAPPRVLGDAVSELAGLFGLIDARRAFGDAHPFDPERIWELAEFEAENGWSPDRAICLWEERVRSPGWWVGTILVVVGLGFLGLFLTA